jgi:hypothetical protein
MIWYEMKGCTTMERELLNNVRVEDLKESVAISRTSEKKEELKTIELTDGQKGGGNCSCNHSSK